MTSSRQLLVPLLAAAALGGGVASTAVVLAEGGGSTTTRTVTTPAASGSSATTATASATTGALSAGQVYRQAKDSVVSISGEVTSGGSGPFGQTQSGQVTGSGFVISKDGLVVTNDHVVADATNIKVQIGTGKTVSAKVVGEDASTDLAVLRIDTGGQDLVPLELGDSSSVQVGDGTYAIGSPYGLDETLTTGVVSALQRDISSPNGYSITGVIQTDAALNPGNSGGPLFNTAGEVIGVNSQIATGGDATSTGGNTGVGFAIPSNTVKRVVDQIVKTGHATHAYLGVQTSDSTSGTGGATVASVTSGGPAAKAGLKAGDVIVEVGDRAVDDSASLAAATNELEPGQQVTVTFRRDGRAQDATITLGTRPAASAQSSSATP